MLEDKPTNRGIPRKQRKKFKKILRSGERAVLKERTRTLINNQTDFNDDTK